jgi:anti-sigma B factor antagonist
MLEVHDQGDKRLRLVGELDAATAPQLQCHLKEHGGATHLDFHDVTFIDSSGLRVLVIAARAADPDAITLLGPNAHVRRVLEMTGLIDSFRIQPEPE